MSIRLYKKGERKKPIKKARVADESETNPGLVFGPSRKQSDELTNRVGPLVERNERLDVRVVAATATRTTNGTTDTVLLSGSAAQNQRLTGYSLSISSSGVAGTVEMLLDGTQVAVFTDTNAVIQAVTDNVTTHFEYKNSILFRSLVLRITRTGGGAGAPITGFLTGFYCVEPGGEGYLSN